MRWRFLFIPALSIVISQLAWAYIPPSRMILGRVSENAGSGIYSIEQEVQIPLGAEPIYLKETWLIENERNLRLTVNGTKDLKDLIHLQFIYVGGQKWQLKNGRKESTKISEDFVEKYFHFRNAENLIGSLQSLKILPVTLTTRKAAVKKGEEFKYEPESFVRLTRTEGSVSYAFGQPSAVEQKELNPGFWVEQDQFIIRKIRFPSQAEVTAENYTPFARGLNLPKLRTIQWNQNTVTIRLLNVSGKVAKSGQLFQPNTLDVPYTIKPLPDASAQTLIEEFYSRFR